VSSSPLDGRDALRRALVDGDIDRLPPCALLAFNSSGRDVVRRGLAEGDLDLFPAVALGDFDLAVLVGGLVVGDLDLDLVFRALADGDLLLDFARSLGVMLRGDGFRPCADASLVSFSSSDPEGCTSVVC
jgi:hypothetical protein